MVFGFRHRPVPPSLLARWDARWKLAAVLLAAAAVAALRYAGPSAAALALGLVLLRVGNLGGAWANVRLAAFALAALPFLIVLPFTLDGPGWDLGPVHLSEHGVLTGVGVLFRGLAVGALVLVLVGTAPVHHTLAAAHRLRAPGLLVVVALLAYRYAFLLADELRRLRVALRVRGFRLKANRHGYRTAGHAVGAMLVRGADRADRVAEAMRARGFDGRFHTLTAFRTTAWDGVGFLLLTTVMGLIVLWDRT